MKIKELFEDTTNNLPHLFICIECDDISTPKSILGVVRETINKQLSKHGFKNIKVNADKEFIEIDVVIPNTSALQYCERAYHTSSNAIEAFDGIGSGSAFEINVDWPPAFPLLFSEECPELIITFQEKASIKGIEKQISYASFISFRNSENISGFLNLLKIKGLDFVEFSGNNVPSEVDNIFNRHLRSGRNLIACQKELYDNDLDEYAEV